MVNVKSYKDGNRLVLVVENCTGELAVKVNAFLSDIIGIESSKPVPALAPVEVKEEAPPKIDDMEPIEDPKPVFQTPPTQKEVGEILIPEGMYQGMTVKNALEQVGLKAAIAISVMFKKFPGQEQTVLNQCKAVMEKDLNSRVSDTASVFEIEEFLNLYQPLIQKTIRQVLQMAGYSELQDFLNFAEEDVLREAYYSILEELKTRIQSST